MKARFAEKRGMLLDYRLVRRIEFYANINRNQNLNRLICIFLEYVIL